MDDVVLARRTRRGRGARVGKMPPDMPKNVRRFVWLWIVSAIIAEIGLYFLPLPNPALGIPHINSTPQIVTRSTLAVLVLLGPLLWLAAWRRKNWARWILATIFVASLPWFFLRQALYEYPTYAGLETISQLVEAAAFWFVFTGDAQLWFKRKI